MIDTLTVLCSNLVNQTLWLIFGQANNSTKSDALFFGDLDGAARLEILSGCSENPILKLSAISHSKCAYYHKNELEKIGDTRAFLSFDLNPSLLCGDRGDETRRE